MKIHFKSLEGRISTLFLTLFIVVQVVNLLVFERGIHDHERTTINSDLDNGQKIFSYLVDENAQRLRTRAQILVKDTTLINAINNENDDINTIGSALANSASLVNADLTMLIDGNRKIKIATATANATDLEQLVMGMLDSADHNNGASAIMILNHKPYHIIVTPVKSPVTIAWVVMGFAIEHHLARDMRRLSELDAVLLTREANGPWLPVATTLKSTTAASETARSLQKMTTTPVHSFDLNINGSLYRAKLVPVATTGTRSASVVLVRSIDAAIAPYHDLQRLLIIITLIGIFIAVLVGKLTAKRITKPITQLADSARQLERGDYSEVIALKRCDEIGALAQALDSMRDGIAKRESEISRLAYWDAVTDLPNRAQFGMLLKEAIHQAKERGYSVFVLMIDLERFKMVNDVLGHSVGDQLLREVGERLQQQVSHIHNSAQVGRLVGNEYAALLPEITLAQAQEIALNITRAFELPITLGNQTVDTTAAIGIAGFPMHAENSDTLLSAVEVATFTAKIRKNGAEVYDPVADKKSVKRLSLMSELRNAIERNEFRLYVQPKLNLATGAIVGVESLIRWIHPERGFVFPDEFIPFAEQSGFIRALTLWVFEQSAIFYKELTRQDLHLKISINLSTRDLIDQELPSKFAEILTRHNVSPSAFCLEITEGTIMSDPVRALQTLDRLHAMGMTLSIDDFGTGYSSLAYLKRLPVDELKIDKSFVMNMVNDEGDTKIVRSTIDLAHNMGLYVVAEGVENEAIWGLLAQLGCDQGQGYFMSKPMPCAELADWIATWQPPVLKPYHTS